MVKKISPEALSDSKLYLKVLCIAKLFKNNFQTNNIALCNC